MLRSRVSDIRLGERFKLFLPAIFQRGHAGEALEEFGEKGGIGEVEVFADLEDGVVTVAKEHLCLGDEGTVDPVLGGGAAGLTDDGAKVALR